MLKQPRVSAMPAWHMEASHQGLLGVSSPRLCAAGGCLLLGHSKPNLSDWKPDSVLLLLLLTKKREVNSCLLGTKLGTAWFLGTCKAQHGPWSWVFQPVGTASLTALTQTPLAMIPGKVPAPWPLGLKHKDIKSWEKLRQEGRWANSHGKPTFWASSCVICLQSLIEEEEVSFEHVSRATGGPPGERTDPYPPSWRSQSTTHLLCRVGEPAHCHKRGLNSGRKGG